MLTWLKLSRLIGVSYTIPDVGDDSWGLNLENFFIAIPQGALQKSGGTFTLSSDVNFGANFGLLASYYKTRGLLPATSGLFRLNLTDTIAWRNNANSANLALAVNGSDQLTFNGSIVTAGGITALTGDVTATGPGSASASIAQILGNPVLGTTGSNNVVFSTSPTLVTPTLGAATGTSLILSGLTASQAIVTNGSKQLISLGYGFSPTGSYLVQRDSNGNASFNNAISTVTSTVTSGQIVTMSGGSAGRQRATGSSNITYNLPDATNLISGWSFYFNNASTGTLTVNQQNGSTLVVSVPSGGIVLVVCIDNSTVQGVWSYSSLMTPGAISSTAGTTLPGVLTATLTNSTGLPLTTGVTGTLPIANGGTGQTSQTNAFDALSPTTTAGDIIVNNGTDNVRQAIGTDGQTLVVDTSQTNKLKWASLPQGNKSYINYSNFENNSTTGWSLGTATLSSTKFPSGAPTFGSGAAGTLAIGTVGGGTQLAGSFSLTYGDTSTNLTAGNFLASSALTLDIEDQAKILGFKFYYSAASGASNCNFSGTSSNTFGVAIYDVTNSAWIQPAGVFNLVQSSGAGIAQGSFQTPSNMTSFRIVLYTANASTGTVTLYLDDFYCGPQAIAFGPAMSDPESFTPTITHSTGGITNYGVSAKKYQVGKYLHVEGLITFTGASASFGSLVVSLPSGLSIDTSVIASTAVGREAFGWTKFLDDGVAHYELGAVVYSSTTGVELFAPSVSTHTGTAPVGLSAISNSFPFTFGANDTIKFSYKVPISGWSSNSVQSADTDTRVISLKADKTGGAHSNNGNFQNVASWNTALIDRAGAFNSTTGIYTVTTSGDFVVSGSVAFDSNATGARVLRVTKNTTTQYELLAIPTASGTCAMPFSCIVPCIAGETLKLEAYQNSGGNLNYAPTTAQNTLSIQRLSGPAVVQATESVNAKYSATTFSGLTGVVILTTKAFDSHNAYNTSTGVYTFPVSGKYEINGILQSGSTAFAVNGVYEAYVSINGSGGAPSNLLGGSRAESTNAVFRYASGSTIVSVNAGDTCSLYQSSSVSTAPAWAGMSITRVGN